MTKSELYSKEQVEKAGLTLDELGLHDYHDEDIKLFQKRVGVAADGFLGPATIEAWRKRAKTPVVTGVATSPATPASGVIIGDVFHAAPKGLVVVPHTAKGGIPASKEDVSPRTRPVTQFVLHRGAEAQSDKWDHGNYAHATERHLDARGLSTTFSMDVDGTIYQHYDPQSIRGRHATHHNVQSDSMDVAGPFTRSKYAAVGDMKPLDIKMACGVEGDNKDPMDRKYTTVKCWTMTSQQTAALAAFLPWYLDLRGIPKRACSDWRTFRRGGLAEKDPVTNVTGILAHTQCSGPGSRVDGCMELAMILPLTTAAGTIEWRDGAHFFS